AAIVGDVPAPLGRYLAWTDEPGPGTLEALIRSGDDASPPRVSQHAKVVILTSGTTGTPKGAQREEPRSLLPFGGLFGKVPFRSSEVMEGCAPMFHALGLTTTMLGVSLGHTLVLRRRFDPVATLDSIERNRVTTVVAVPAMLSRMVEAAPEHRTDTSSLRIVFMAGSQLGADLCVRATETF